MPTQDWRYSARASALLRLSGDHPFGGELSEYRRLDPVGDDSQPGQVALFHKQTAGKDKAPSDAEAAEFWVPSKVVEVISEGCEASIRYGRC
jgi:hypothetical protein